MPRGWFTLGVWLMEGRHVAADPALARACLDRAASADYPLAGQLRDALTAAPADAMKALQLQADPAASPEPSTVTPEVLSRSPKIELLRRFVPVEVRAHLIARARPMIEPSRVLTRSGSLERDTIRTSGDTSLLPELLDVSVWHLLERLHRAVDIPVENGEPLIVLQYTPGTEYKPHYDYFDPADPGYSTGLRAGGQRIYTLLTYLNDVEAGGATTFPELGIEVAPEAGTVLAFRNVDEQGNVDSRTLHAGLPVQAGDKWLATRWIRSGAFIHHREGSS